MSRVAKLIWIGIAECIVGFRFFLFFSERVDDYGLSEGEEFFFILMMCLCTAAIFGGVGTFFSAYRVHRQEREDEKEEMYKRMMAEVEFKVRNVLDSTDKEPQEPKLREGEWLCICGRINKNYVYRCACNCKKPVEVEMESKLKQVECRGQVECSVCFRKQSVANKICEQCGMRLKY